MGVAVYEFTEVKMLKDRIGETVWWDMDRKIVAGKIIGFQFREGEPFKFTVERWGRNYNIAKDELYFDESNVPSPAPVKEEP